MAAALPFIGPALRALGSIQQGNTAAAQADLQAQILRQQAKSERQQARANESQFRGDQSRAQASRRAALGASGVDPSTGSPLAVSVDIAGETELQALRIRHGGEVRSTRLQQQALLQSFAGSAAQQQGRIRAGAELIKGAGKAFS